jgi:hypothetical protein
VVFQFPVNPSLPREKCFNEKTGKIVETVALKTLRLKQGILTEGEGTVQLISLNKLV